MKFVILGALAPLVYVVVIKAALGSDAAQLALAALIAVATGAVLIRSWDRDRRDRATLEQWTKR